MYTRNSTIHDIYTTCCKACIAGIYTGLTRTWSHKDLIPLKR